MYLPYTCSKRSKKLSVKGGAPIHVNDNIIVAVLFAYSICFSQQSGLLWHSFFSQEIPKCVKAWEALYK